MSNQHPRGAEGGAPVRATPFACAYVEVQQREACMVHQHMRSLGRASGLSYKAQRQQDAAREYAKARALYDEVFPTEAKESA